MKFRNKLFGHLKIHVSIYVFLSSYFVIFSYKLTHFVTPFFDWDESIYAQVGREMINKVSLVPLWQGQVWLDKPPLVPLIYGVVMKSFPFILPEVSTRIFSLVVATLLLAMIYTLYFKVIKNSWITTLIIIITAFSSLFLQRALVLNIDIFLLIGWIGYILFYKKKYTSTFFLAIAVLSKSLVGFYPAFIMIGYTIFLKISKKIDQVELGIQLKKILIQISILLTWYAVMYFIYKGDFINQHIYETHFKRVTASIESHFGQRTFYIDLLFENYGRWIWLSVLGSVLILWKWKTKKLSDIQLLYGFFILPWFFFLNLTKTKIFWYSHPYIPQFAFLMTYPLVIFSFKQKKFYLILFLTIFTLILKHYVVDSKVFDAQFSSNAPHHEVAKYANRVCDSLYDLVPEETRVANETLEKMNLTITTTKWWGDHPSIVYYFDKPVHFVYKLNAFNKITQTKEAGTCIIVTKSDLGYIEKNKNFTILKIIEPLYLYGSLDRIK